MAGFIVDALKINCRGTLHNLENISHFYFHQTISGPEWTVMCRLDTGDAVEIFRGEEVDAKHVKIHLDALIELDRMF